MLSNSQSSVLIDENSSGSELSDLDSELFESQSTNLKRDRDDLPEHQERKKRKLTARAIWAHARPAKPEEQAKDKHGHTLWYCAKCGHQCASLGRAREHMLK